MSKLAGLVYRLLSNWLTGPKWQNRLARRLWLEVKDEFWSPHHAWCYSEICGVHLEYGSYCADGVATRLARGTSIGRYSSIGPNVASYNANHPLTAFSLHPMFYNPVCGFVAADQLSRINLRIERDVWIGANTIILPSVRTIGAGAVIGAGSVVVKDVPPYAIVAGNPAVVKRMRFDPDVVSALEGSRWWTLDRTELYQQRARFQSLCTRESRAFPGEPNDANHR